MRNRVGNFDDIMTIEEVAGYLKLKPQTIYTWAQNNKIPAAKIGKEWRFRKSMIDEWFDSHFNEAFLPKKKLTKKEN